MNPMATSFDLHAAQMADPGTRQADRLNPHLDAAYAPLDERQDVDLVLAAHALAAKLNFYEDSPEQVAGNWQEILQGSLLRPLPGDTPDSLRARVAALMQGAEGAVGADGADGKLPPHLALLMVFAKLARHPRTLLNDFTRQHLNFQMQTVLAFTPKAAQPDHAHVLVDLKKGAPALELQPGQWLSGGKDAQQQELLYQPVRPTVLNHAKVAQLRSVSHASHRLVCAPIADSIDGLGGKLPPDNPVWPPFAQALPDRPALPSATTGFALASPLLRLSEGTRTVTLTLYLDGLRERLSAEALAASFEVLLSGPKGWIGPYALKAVSSTAAKQRALQFTLEADQPAVVDLSDVHAQPFEAGLPVAQLLLKPDGLLGHDALAGLSLQQVKLAVVVKDMRKLVLEGELGALDAKKPFLPFGSQPAEGSRFFIGCAEALGKSLSALTLNMVWQGAPTTQADLTTRYASYTNQASLAHGVAVQADWADARAQHKTATGTILPAATTGIQLDLDKANYKVRKVSKGRLQEAYALYQSGSAVARKQGDIKAWLHQQQHENPYQNQRENQRQNQQESQRQRPPRQAEPPEPPVPATVRPGFITLSLTTDLLHGDYRNDAIRMLLLTADAKPPTVIQEPYTPKLKELTLSYEAETERTAIHDESLSAFTEAEVAFYHVDVFGVAREHLWLSRQRSWMKQASVSLLPRHTAAGELFIGVSGVQAGEPLSLLLQAQEGSADPLAHVQAVRWSVLADNAWQALNPGPDLPLDTTSGLRRSGLINVVLPGNVTTDNTRMPAGLVWLRAAIAQEPRAACSLVGVHANAVEVAWVDQGLGASHLANALPAGRITRLKSPVAEIKALSQPYPSFGGALMEDDAALSRRAAERLRHRGRAITPWDHERLVLEAFPMLDRVKCIPYANSQSWRAPGCVMLVVVPNLRLQHQVGLLTPRVDLDTLQRIEAFVLQRSAMCLQATPAGQTSAPTSAQTSAVTVRNPRYQPVQLSFKVCMRDGFAFSYYKAQLNQAIVQTLSPWAFDVGRPLNFGGRVVRSALVDAIESLDYVDYITDVKLARIDHPGEDQPELAPQEPDVILVSATEHDIQEIT